MLRYALGFLSCLILLTAGTLLAQEAGVFQITGYYDLRMDAVSKTANLHLNSMPPRQTSPYRWSYDAFFVTVSKEGYERIGGAQESESPTLPSEIIPEKLDDERVAWMLTRADELNTAMTDEEWGDLTKERIGVTVGYQFFTGPNFEGDFSGEYVVIPRNGTWFWTRTEHSSNSGSALDTTVPWPEDEEEK